METIEMKLLSKDILHEYGFIENEMKTDTKKEVLTRDNFDIVFKDGNYYYSNTSLKAKALKLVSDFKTTMSPIEVDIG